MSKSCDLNCLLLAMKIVIEEHFYEILRSIIKLSDDALRRDKNNFVHFNWVLTVKCVLKLQLLFYRRGLASFVTILLVKNRIIQIRYPKSTWHKNG